MTPATALLAATAVHLGFQATVTAVVYPALCRVPADRWAAAHRAHARAISPVVAAVYAGLLLAAGWVALSGPDAWTAAAIVALAGSGLSTVLAARVHGRLGGGRDPEAIGRLIRIDRFRAATAVIAFAAAVLAL